MKNKLGIKSLLLVVIFPFLIMSECNDNNEMPGCQFNLPLSNSTYFAGEDIIIDVYAFDSDGSVTSVELSLDGESLVTLNSSPFEYTHKITNLGPGEYTLRALATDDHGDAVSAEILVRIIPDLDEFTDPRDDNSYRYVTIGGKTWMADNVAYLPEVQSPDDSSSLEPCYYVSGYEGTNIDEAKATANYAKYGVLYNFEAAKMACPEGWHIPSGAEWDELIQYVMQNYSNSIYGKYLMHTSEGGNNYFGFSVLTAGGKHQSMDIFGELGVRGIFWSTSDFIHETRKNEIFTTWFGLQYASGYDGGGVLKTAGISLRCVKD